MYAQYVPTVRTALLHHIHTLHMYIERCVYVLYHALHTCTVCYVHCTVCTWMQSDVGLFLSF